MSGSHRGDGRKVTLATTGQQGSVRIAHHDLRMRQPLDQSMAPGVVEVAMAVKQDLTA